MGDKKEALENYETVKERKKRFYEKFPDGRIVPECIRADEKGALFKATIFKNAEEQSKSMPLAVGFAQEIKGQGSFANKTSWTENCEESAVGRALDNGGFSGNNRCSREEIEQAEKNAVALIVDAVTNAPEEHQLDDDPHFQKKSLPFGRSLPKGKAKFSFDDCAKRGHRSRGEPKFGDKVNYDFCYDCWSKIPKVG